MNGYLVLALWFVTSPITYAGSLACFTRYPMPVSKQRRRECVSVSVLFALMGPCGFVISLLSTGFYAYGFSFTGKTRA